MITTRKNLFAFFKENFSSQKFVYFAQHETQDVKNFFYELSDFINLTPQISDLEKESVVGAICFNATLQTNKPQFNISLNLENFFKCKNSIFCLNFSKIEESDIAFLAAKICDLAVSSSNYFCEQIFDAKKIKAANLFYQTLNRLIEYLDNVEEKQILKICEVLRKLDFSNYSINQQFCSNLEAITNSVLSTRLSLKFLQKKAFCSAMSKNQILQKYKLANTYFADDAERKEISFKLKELSEEFLKITMAEMQIVEKCFKTFKKTQKDCCFSEIQQINNLKSIYNFLKGNLNVDFSLTKLMFKLNLL